MNLKYNLNFQKYLFFTNFNYNKYIFKVINF